MKKPKKANKKAVNSTPQFASTPQSAYFDCWGYKVNVVFSTAVDKSIQEYFPTHVPDKNMLACHMFLPDEAASTLFFPFNVRIGDLTHECWHAVHRVLKYQGAAIDNETVAYHLGWLVEIVVKFQKIANKNRRAHGKQKHTKRRRSR